MPAVFFFLAGYLYSALATSYLWEIFKFPLLREAGDFYGQLKYFIMWYLAANQEVFHIIMQDNHWA